MILAWFIVEAVFVAISSSRLAYYRIFEGYAIKSLMIVPQNKLSNDFIKGWKLVRY